MLPSCQGGIVFWRSAKHEIYTSSLDVALTPEFWVKLMTGSQSPVTNHTFKSAKADVAWYIPVQLQPGLVEIRCPRPLSSPEGWTAAIGESLPCSLVTTKINRDSLQNRANKRRLKRLQSETLRQSAWPDLPSGIDLAIRPSSLRIEIFLVLIILDIPLN